VIAALARARHDGTESSPAVNPCPAEDLELPGPLRLLLTAGWNLGESVGLPVAAYVAAAWLDDHDTGLVAGLVAIWLTAAIRKVVTGAVPSLLTISAVVLTLQTALVLATGDLWLFPLQFPLGNLCMCVLFARTARGPNPLVPSSRLKWSRRNAACSATSPLATCASVSRTSTSRSLQCRGR
jgi:hypothetical protein